MGLSMKDDRFDRLQAGFIRQAGNLYIAKTMVSEFWLVLFQSFTGQDEMSVARAVRRFSTYGVPSGFRTSAKRNCTSVPAG